MTSSVDREGPGSGPTGSHWPFDLISSAARRPPCFKQACELITLLAELPINADFGLPSIQEVCARGAALVAALRPEDYLFTEGPADDRRDVYRSQYGGRPLRLCLSVFSFPGNPPVLLVTIAPLGKPDLG